MSTHDPVALARELRAGEHRPRPELAALQQRRLDALVRHAREHSPLHRERLPAPDGPVALAALPVLDRATLVERFGELACVAPGADEPRILCSSGSSGRPARFAYDAEGWAGFVAQFLRVTAMTGLPLWEHPGLRVAVVSASDRRHASAQVAMTCAALGLLDLRPRPVTLPLERIVAALEDDQPDVLHAYPSYAALLADEQLAGRLHIAPRLITTSSELLTADMAARIEAAFGVRPFDFYATTEGAWAAQCAERAGFHVFEDCCLVENVDAAGDPVPDGEPGARILVTPLLNRALPLIRYEIPDVVVFDPEPCPCGTLRRIRSVHGRHTELLALGGATVHPLQFAALAADPGVREFQVVQDGDRLRLRIVLAEGPGAADTPARVRDRVAAALRAAGAGEPRLDVEPCAAIERPASGKLQLVVADPRVRAPA